MLNVFVSNTFLVLLDFISKLEKPNLTELKFLNFIFCVCVATVFLFLFLINVSGHYTNVT